MSPTRERFTSTAGVSASKGAYPFSIDVDFGDELTPDQRDAFRSAARRWLKIIVAGGPAVEAGGEVVDGLLILARCASIERKGGLLANTDIDLSALRGPATGPTAHLPGKATITLDKVGMEELDAQSKEPASAQTGPRDVGPFRIDLIAHEIGHALGLSRPVWERKFLLDRNAHTRSPLFTGSAAAKAYGAARGTGPTAVPLEIFGDKEEFIAHWRQAFFHSELMTFMLEDSPNVIGPVTVGALQDLGYEVDAARAETGQIDFTGTAPSAPTPTGRAADPAHVLLRNHRWINCRVSAG